MVALTGTTPATLRSPVPKSVLAGRGGLVRFTVDDVLAMLRQGILPEDASTELLDGVVVLKDRADRGGDPTMHGPKHRMCIVKFTRLAARFDARTQDGQVQLPIVLADDGMSEPDFALIRGPADGFADRLPTAADALFVIEAADSSLDRDREEKLPAYAAAGVPQYLIADLTTDAVELHTQPDPLTRSYRASRVFARSEVITLITADGEVEIAAADLLP